MSDALSCPSPDERRICLSVPGLQPEDECVELIHVPDTLSIAGTTCGHCDSVSPSFAPSPSPTAYACDDVDDFGICDPADRLMCVNNLQECIHVENVPSYLKAPNSFCGRCPTDQPSASPSEASLAPTVTLTTCSSDAVVPCERGGVTMCLFNQESPLPSEYCANPTSNRNLPQVIDFMLNFDPRNKCGLCDSASPTAEPSGAPSTSSMPSSNPFLGLPSEAPTDNPSDAPSETPGLCADNLVPCSYEGNGILDGITLCLFDSTTGFYNDCKRGDDIIRWLLFVDNPLNYCGGKFYMLDSNLPAF